MSDLDERRIGLADCPVELLSWPSDARRRESLARVGVPRVLLVEPGAEPPARIGLDEDWIRMPADDEDVRLKAIQLSRSTAHLHDDAVFIDEHRILHRSGVTVPLSHSEAAILDLLLDHRGSVVTFGDLQRRVWNGATQSRDAIDAAIYRLRRRLSGLNVVIRSVRNRGFVIDR